MRYVFFTAIFFLTGCGTTSSVKIAVTPVETAAFRFEDQRLLDRRLTVKSRDSEGNEINILGDDAITPTPGVLVRSWLQANMVKTLAGRGVILREFEVRVHEPAVVVDEGQFAQAAYSVPGANPLVALLARAVVGGIESARSEKTVSVSIGATLDQWPFQVNSKASFQGRVTESNVKTVIESALGEVKRELERHVESEVGLGGETPTNSAPALEQAPSVSQLVVPGAMQAPHPGL